jgi:hypothetical protein
MRLACVTVVTQAKIIFRYVRFFYIMYMTDMFLLIIYLLLKTFKNNSIL